jgi:hypothetical protein
MPPAIVERSMADLLEQEALLVMQLVADDTGAGVPVDPDDASEQQIRRPAEPQLSGSR